MYCIYLFLTVDCSLENYIDGNEFLTLEENDVKTLIPPMGLARKIIRLLPSKVNLYACTCNYTAILFVICRYHLVPQFLYHLCHHHKTPLHLCQHLLTSQHPLTSALLLIQMLERLHVVVRHHQCQ